MVKFGGLFSILFEGCERIALKPLRVGVHA